MSSNHSRAHSLGSFDDLIDDGFSKMIGVHLHLVANGVFELGQSFLHTLVIGAIFVLGVITGGLSNVTSGGAGLFTIFVLTKYAGLSFQESVGTVLASSTLMVLFGAVTFYRQRQVNRLLSLTLGVSGILSSFLSAEIASSIQAAPLERGFGLFTLFIAFFSIYQILRSRRSKNSGVVESQGKQNLGSEGSSMKDSTLLSLSLRGNLPPVFGRRAGSSSSIGGEGVEASARGPDYSKNRWAGSDPLAISLQVALGIAIGVATGLFGVGGAGLTLAALMLVFKLRAKEMLGTSLMASFFRYAGGSFGYRLSGQISLLYFAVMTIGGAIGAVSGARFIMKEKTKDSYIQLIVIALFFFISYEFLVK